MAADRKHMKLGRIAPRTDRLSALPLFPDYAAKLPPPPPSVTWSDKVASFGMLANDSVGDCTAAAVAHLIQLWTTANGNGVVPTDQETLDFYSTVTGYDPADPMTDQGAVMVDVLSAWHKQGITIGGKVHKLAGYARTRVGHHTHVKQAIQIAGGVCLGVALPEAWFDSDVWDVGRGPKYRLAGGHEVPACFSGETAIPLLNGGEIRIGDLSEGEQLWVYSISDAGRIVPGRAVARGRTGRARDLVRVILDNEDSVVCTPDHLFMLRDGAYRAAISLEPGVSLMPLRRKLSTRRQMFGYEMCHDTLINRWEFTHRLVAASKGEDLTGLVVHHDDFDKRNNEPGNLITMTWEEHTKLHADEVLKLNEYARSSDGRAKSREVMREHWGDPEWAAKMKWQLNENRKRGNQRIKDEFASGLRSVDKEKYRANGLASVGNLLRGDAAREAMRVLQDEFRERFANDPEFRAQVRARAAANIRKAHGKPVTEAQRSARRLNAQRLAYRRFHADKFASFEEYLSATNHKVVAVEPAGQGDVFDLTVPEHGNFGLKAGAFVHNCDYDADTLTVVSWGRLYKMTWRALDKYCEEVQVPVSADWADADRSPSGFDLETLLADMGQLRTPRA